MFLLKRTLKLTLLPPAHSATSPTTNVLAPFAASLGVTYFLPRPVSIISFVSNKARPCWVSTFRYVSPPPALFRFPNEKLHFPCPTYHPPPSFHCHLCHLFFLSYVKGSLCQGEGGFACVCRYGRKRCASLTKSMQRFVRVFIYHAQANTHEASTNVVTDVGVSLR